MSATATTSTASCPPPGQLFDLRQPAAAGPVPSTPLPATPRLKRAERDQVVLRPLALDQLLPDDHEARAVWHFVDRLDLACLYQTIRAVEGHVGRSPIDPKILLALWLYATLRGVGSARQLDELCADHHAYQWLCGGVSVNYHTLADFRTAHGDLLDRLLTESVACLRHAGLVDMVRVAQDGLRVRAS